MYIAWTQPRIVSDRVVVIRVPDMNEPDENFIMFARNIYNGGLDPSVLALPASGMADYFSRKIMNDSEWAALYRALGLPAYKKDSGVTRFEHLGSHIFRLWNPDGLRTLLDELKREHLDVWREAFRKRQERTIARGNSAGFLGSFFVSTGGGVSVEEQCSNQHLFPKWYRTLAWAVEKGLSNLPYVDVVPLHEFAAFPREETLVYIHTLGACRYTTYRKEKLGRRKLDDVNLDILGASYYRYMAMRSLLSSGIMPAPEEVFIPVETEYV